MLYDFSLEAVELHWGDLHVLNFGVLETVNQIGAFDNDSSWQ
jgi:hypothetical protein